MYKIFNTLSVVFCVAAFVTTVSCSDKGIVPAVANPTIIVSQNEFNVDASAQQLNIFYTVSNAVEGGELTVWSPDSWIVCPEASPVTSESSTVTLDVLPNQLPQARSTSLVVSYKWNEGESDVSTLVTVSQSAGSSTVFVSFDEAEASSYWRYDADLFSVDLQLSSIEETPAGVQYGYILSSRLFMTLSPGGKIISSNYSISDTRTVGAIDKDFTHITIYHEDGSVTRHYPESATATITPDGDNYSVKVSMTSSDGLTFDLSYDGQIVVSGLPKSDTNLSEDMDLGRYDWSVEYMNRTSVSSGVTCYNFFFSSIAEENGETVYPTLELAFFVEEGKSDISGTYTVSSDETAGTVLRSYDEQYVYDGMSVFTNRSTGLRACIYSGSMTVMQKDNADGTTTYTFDLDFYDRLDEPNHIYGSFSVDYEW